jgi:hypothetical protein
MYWNFVAIDGVIKNQINKQQDATLKGMFNRYACLNALLIWYTALQNVYKPSDLKQNSVALVRDRTVPTERTPLVGEGSTNFCR